MEIREYLRRSRPRLLLFVVVPLVAAALAGLIGATRPATHRVHALVEVPTLGNDAPATVDRSVANFRTALRSGPVLDSTVARQRRMFHLVWPSQPPTMSTNQLGPGGGNVPPPAT